MMLNILVVLYDTELTESNSLGTLKNINHDLFKSARLLIVNNGPKPLNDKSVCDFKKQFHSVQVHELLVNVSLAKIYNKFIDAYSAEYTLVLDHDTCITVQFINSLCENINSKQLGFDLLIPGISSDGEVRYPVYIYYGLVKSSVFKLPPIDKKSELQSISSGLVLSKNAYLKVVSEYGDCFDERFNIYCIDTSFFHRVDCLSLNVKILDTCLEHDLSHLKNNQNVENKFRDYEIMHGIAASCKPYAKIKYYILTLLYLLKLTSKLDFIGAGKLCCTFILSKVIK
jgi:hypothetical protein